MLRDIVSGVSYEARNRISLGIWYKARPRACKRSNRVLMKESSADGSTNVMAAAPA